MAFPNDGIYLDRPHQKRGCVQHNMSPTLKTSGNDIGVVVEIERILRIRKFTPLECWRLMSFDDEDFYKAQKVGVSNSQLYKQAGNSIVVEVFYYLLKELYEALPEVFEDLKVFSLFSGIGAPEKALQRLYSRTIK